MENSCTKINDLGKLIQKSIGRDCTVIEYSSKPLTSAGENYGSEILALDIKLRQKETSRILNAIAKLCPPNEYLREVFDTPVSFKKEVAVYTTIIPALIEFQTERNVTDTIGFFPKCYGARISLDPTSDVVDDDAVLILENLKMRGFKVEDRMKSFDLETTRLLLKDLAVFHAVPVAMKRLKPDVFAKTVLSRLNRNTIFDGLSEMGMQIEIKYVTEIAEQDEECERLMPNIVKSLVNGFQMFTKDSTPREPFATISHNDYWINNTMLMYENGRPTRNKMLDFQLVDYGSPGKDIVFFLFTSVKVEVLENHYDELLKVYYEKFIRTLSDLGCDTAPFTFELLKEEIDVSAKGKAFVHIMIMLRHVFGVKGKAKELCEVTEEDLGSDELLSDECKQRVKATILYFSRNGWI